MLRDQWVFYSLQTGRKLGVCLLGLAALQALLESVAIPVPFQQMAMVLKAIHESGGHGPVAKNRFPLCKRSCRAMVSCWLAISMRVGNALSHR